MSRASPANRADLSHELFNFQQHNVLFSLMQAFKLLKAALPFNFSSPEYLSPKKRRKNLSSARLAGQKFCENLRVFYHI